MRKHRSAGSYAKIIAITVAVVAGACAVIWFAMKLYRKYCLLECVYDEALEDISEDSLCDGECELVLDDAEN